MVPLAVMSISDTLATAKQALIFAPRSAPACWFALQALFTDAAVILPKISILKRVESAADLKLTKFPVGLLSVKRTPEMMSTPLAEGARASVPTFDIGELFRFNPPLILCVLCALGLLTIGNGYTTAFEASGKPFETLIVPAFPPKSCQNIGNPETVAPDCVLSDTLYLVKLGTSSSLKRSEQADV